MNLTENQCLYHKVLHLQAELVKVVDDKYIEVAYEGDDFTRIVNKDFFQIVERKN